MKLIEYVSVNKTIKCISGVHIGASKDNIEIGGIDLPIIKHPLTGMPYIPGSSLKGKIRSLLELKYSSRTQQTGDPCGCGDCKICKGFGAHRNSRSPLGPTRFIFRDSELTTEWKEKLISLQISKGTPTEIKHENTINRMNGIAKDPRPNERIPSGTELDFSVTIRVFDGDKKEELIALLDEGMKLLEQDYIGGAGSRGSGQIKFV